VIRTTNLTGFSEFIDYKKSSKVSKASKAGIKIDTKHFGANRAQGDAMFAILAL
jgi:hypothetical protein